MAARTRSFSRELKQKIIEDYLAESGKNLFIPSEFITWLEPRTDHVAWAWFFKDTDEEAAFKFRCDLARAWAREVRHIVRTEVMQEHKVVSIVSRDMPGLISPMSHRGLGGGYIPLDPDDDAAMDELRRQGVVSLRSWVRRYGAAFEAAGISVAPFADIIDAGEEWLAQNDTTDGAGAA